MKEIYCLPLTAATNRLHLGNLYSWILADSYKRASNLLNVNVELRESWNCTSKKLEDDVSSKWNLSSQKKVDKCREIVEDNISNAQNIFLKYGIEFSLPAIRDDSREYREMVIEMYHQGKETGKIKNFFLQLPRLEDVIKKASKIDFYPEDSVNSIRGISTLKDVISIPLLREGDYGIRVDGIKEKVLGQRYVQSLLPEFYKKYLDTPDIAIFGKDVLAKWVYFMVANSNKKVFNKLGLHGLILKKDGGKISKYDSNIPLIEDITSSPDNIRLSLLKQSFGMDFKFPNFDEEEKFRRKIENCFNFFINYKGYTERQENYISKLSNKGEEISNKLRRLNFSEAYQEFRLLTYDISSRIIPEIKNSGISERGLEKIVSYFKKVSNIFVPVTVQKVANKIV